MKAGELVSEPIDHFLHGQRANPSMGRRFPKASEFLRQHDPYLAEQIAEALQQQSVNRVLARRCGFALILLAVARLDAEASPVQLAKSLGLLMDVPSVIAAPALEGEQHGLRSSLPQKRSRPHLPTGLFRRPLHPANLFVFAFEANIARVAARSFATQGERIGKLPLLQKQQGLAAVEAAVERDAADFQAFFGDLIEQETDDLVRF